MRSEFAPTPTGLPQELPDVEDALRKIGKKKQKGDIGTIPTPPPGSPVLTKEAEETTAPQKKASAKKKAKKKAKQKAKKKGKELDPAVESAVSPTDSKRTKKENKSPEDPAVATSPPTRLAPAPAPAPPSAIIISQPEGTTPPLSTKPKRRKRGRLSSSHQRVVHRPRCLHPYLFLLSHRQWSIPRTTFLPFRQKP